MRSEQMNWVTDDGLRLYVTEWLPDKDMAEIKGLVCLIHGMGEHSGRHQFVIDHLIRAAYIVIAVDLRGHGQSEGNRGHAPSYAHLMTDIAGILNLASARHPGVRCYLYGHSMGGNLVINYALRSTIASDDTSSGASMLRHAPPIYGVIASSPWLRLAFRPPLIKEFLGQWIHRIWPEYKDSTGLEPSSLTRNQDILQTRQKDPLIHDVITARFFINITAAGEWALKHADQLTIPLLLMHGDQDRVTSMEASQEFAQSAGSLCQYKPWSGCYHELHHEPEREQVIEDVIAWLDRIVDHQRIL